MIGLVYIPVDTKNNNTIPSASASGGFQVKTGYYLGTGSPQTIDVGFEPELVLLKGSNTVGAAWKTIAMLPENISFLTANAGAVNTDSQLSFETNGFTVATNDAVNQSSILYTYIAMTGSDCTSSGVFCVGSYTGDSNASQVVSTGFSPDLVWVTSPTEFDGNFRTAQMTDNHGARFGSGAMNTNGTLFQTLNSDSFTVGATNNTVDIPYHFVAFSLSSGVINFGAYTGDGVVGREITGLGFAPRFVLTKRLSTTSSIFTTDEVNATGFYSAAAGIAGGFTELLDDGFGLTGALSSNFNSAEFVWFAIGEQEPIQVNAGEDFTMKTGSYTGNGGTQTISGIGFDPDLVIIKAHTANTLGTVFRTSMDIDGLTFPLGLAGAGFTDGITGMGSGSFQLGSDSNVNGSGIIYEYVVFGNATTPYKSGSPNFMMGIHHGTSIANQKQKIRLGSSFDFFATKARNATTVSVFKTSVMDDLVSAYFTNTGNNTNGSMFGPFDSSGILLGNSASTNGSTNMYTWFAFKENPFFTVGTYTGNGVTDREINTIGFQPDWAFIKRSTNIVGVHRINSSTLSGDVSQYFTNIANAGNLIKSFLMNGFTVSNVTNVNANTGVYNYAAWKIPIDMSGTLEVMIVDDSDEPIVSPSMEMSLADYSELYQTSSGNLGTSTQKIRVSNTTAGPAWSVAIAASDGPTAVWDSGTNSYDYNDPTAGANDGADSDSVGGQMTIDPSTGTITPQSGCSTTGVSFAGGDSFSEGVEDSITLLSASGATQTDCYWDITDITVTQTIPESQNQGVYTIPMTLTIIAS